LWCRLSDNSGVDAQDEPNQQRAGAKYWELIADRLHASGWSYGISSERTESGELLHCVDAHHNGRRFIVRSDELLTAFLELETQTKQSETG
jgi:hypothetical protein